jgi:hypothetical protein
LCTRSWLARTAIRFAIPVKMPDALRRFRQENVAGGWA